MSEDRKTWWKVMKNWLRKKLYNLLNMEDIHNHIYRHENEIKKLEKLTNDLVSIGVDVNFKEPHMILIYSRLNGGQIREIPAQFDNLRDLEEFVKELKERYRTKVETWDKPPTLRDIWG